MRRFTGIARLVTALAVPIALLACGRGGTEPGPASALTNEPFFITGAITETGHPWGYRVKGEPGTSYRVTELCFKVGPSTVIKQADGSDATVAELAVGRSISLWITGAIAQSLPPRGGMRG